MLCREGALNQHGCFLEFQPPRRDSVRPASAINDYKTTNPWSEFGTIKEIEGTSAKAVKESVPVLISANNGLITVKGELDGEPVVVYTAEGKLMGSGTINGGLATVSTSLGAGMVAVVKIGQKAVKVVMR